MRVDILLVFAYYTHIAPVVKWISLLTSDQSFQVRVLAGALAKRGGNMLLSCCTARIWFSGKTRPCQGRVGSSILPIRTKQSETERTAKMVVLSVRTPVDNLVDTGDKGQGQLPVSHGTNRFYL